MKALCAAATLGVLALVSVASATPVLQRKAAEAGFPARDCRYCHTFDTGHMRERARKLGISNMNCGACHPARLPKTGLALMNERGRFLVTEKYRSKASEVDVAWLHAYVPPSPSPKPAAPRP